MNEPDTPSPPVAADRYERWTRILARAAALVLALSVLLPRLWLNAIGGLTVLWPWERRPDSTDGSWVDNLFIGEGGLSPALALLLVISGIAWMSAKRLPLAHRGRWLVVPTLLGLSLAGGYRSVPNDSPLHLAGTVGWLVLAVLGLALSGMVAYRRLGAALCAVAGLFILGICLWPMGDWEWPLLRGAFAPERPDSARPLDLILVLLALALGALLSWAGLSGEPSRVVRRLTIGVLLAAIGVGLISHVVFAFGHAEGQDWSRALVRAWNLLRFVFVPYAEALLIAVGLFAWIVGTRQVHPLETVFD